jgi:TP901 family phage tail tape measure protein
MAVTVAINSAWNDRGQRQALAAMRRFERQVKGTGGTVSDKTRKQAESAIRMIQSGEKIKAIGQKAAQYGQALTRTVTLPLVSAGALAVNEYKKFDQALNEAYAIMDDVDDKTKKQMESTARKVATTTRISHEAAASSYYYLASAGYDAQQSIKALPAVAKFAQAGMFDMETATSLAADTQSALGMRSKDSAKNVKQLTRVTDVFTHANNLANGEVKDFAESMTNKAGPALRVAKKSIEEGTAVLMVLANQGVKGAEAGESLNIFLRDLPRAQNKNEKMWKKLGISVFDAKGKMKNAADIVAMFEKKLGKMSDKEKAATLEMLGINRGAADVTRKLLGTSKSIRNYEKQLKSAGGATETVANKQMNSLASKLDLAKNKLRDMGISVAPSLVNGFVMPAVKWLEKLSASWNKMSQAQQQSTVKMAVGAAAAGPVLTMLGKMAVGVGNLTTAYGKFKTAAAAAGGIGNLISSSTGGMVTAVIAGTIAVGGLSYALHKSYYEHKYAASTMGKVETAARRSATAQRDAASAARELAAAERASSQSALSVEQAELNLEQAKLNKKRAKKTKKKDPSGYKQAVHDEKQALADLEEAQRVHTENVNAEVDKRKKKVETEVEKYHSAQDRVSKMYADIAEQERNGTISKTQADNFRSGYEDMIKAGEDGNKKLLDQRVQFWKDFEKNANTPEQKKTAKEVQQQLQDLYTVGKEGKNKSLADTHEFANRIGREVKSGAKKAGDDGGKGMTQSYTDAVKSRLRSAKSSGAAVSSTVHSALTTGAKKSGSAGTATTKYYEGGVQKSSSAAKTSAASVAAKANTGFNSSEKKKKANTIGVQYGAGFAIGILSKRGAVSTATTLLVGTALKVLRALGIVKSPSKKTYKIGGHYGEGFALGIASK